MYAALKPTPLSALLASVLAAQPAWAANIGCDGAYLPNCYGTGSVTIDTYVNGEVAGKQVTGGSADASRATVTITAGGASLYVRGGYARRSDNATASGNTVTMTGGRADYEVYGGWAYADGSNGTASGNTVDISGDAEVALNVFGGYAKGLCTVRATGNTVIVRVNAGTAMQSVFGGRAQYRDIHSTCPGASSAEATNNYVHLYSGRIAGDVQGGLIWGTPDSKEDVRGNELHVHAKGLNVGGDASNFEKLFFTLPAGIAPGEPMLNVGGAAEFPAAATTVNIALAPGAKLTPGDKITLIAAGSLNITLARTTITGGGYEFELDASDGQNLYATVTKLLPPSGATAVPTLGGAELALSSMALAGAAVPALRRRKKQGKKADTLR